MRRWLPSAILVTFVLAAGLLLTPVAARAVGVTPTLRLSPDHGQASDSFTATYNLSPCQASPGTSIDFYWNEYPPNGGQRLGAATLDATCTARLIASPPAGTSPGSDLVYGFWALPDGSPLAGTIAARAYTVDPPPVRATPTPTPSSPAGPSPTAGGPTPPGPTGDSDSWLQGGLQSSSSAGASANSSGSGFGPPPYVNTPLGRISLVALLLAAVALLLLLLLLAIALLIASRRTTERQTVDRAA